MREFLSKLAAVILLAAGTTLFGQLMQRPNDAMIKQALQQSLTDSDMQAEDLNFQLTDFYANRQNGIQHIYFRQTFNGLEIIGTESSIHLGKNGQISSVKSKFVNSLQKRGNTASKSPQITAVQAVNSAASHLGYFVTKPVVVLSQSFTEDRETLLSDGGIARSNIPAKLLYWLDEEGNLKLVWELSIEANNQSEWYNLRIDASNGNVLEKGNWVLSCDFGYRGEAAEAVTDHFHYGVPHNASEKTLSPLALPGAYKVLEMPLESPYFGDRTMVNADDAVNLTASPYGWHDTNGQTGAEYTTTRGNNVNAYEDGDNSGYQPDGGSDLIFDFPFNPNYSYGDQSEAAAITNLFYWNNIIHDVSYQYGFDEISGNFQQNNYGNGGAGNDYVRAEAQDGSGTCNANFGTPPDGQSPTMQMYVCGNKDGDFDNVVIVHEYTHGISIRLTGGPSQVNCLWNDEQMGEGWGDWLGLMLTMKDSDTATQARGIGTWLFNDGPNGAGIRSYPYTTDMSINPFTYDSIKTEAVPHGVGSVWATMLWDLSWALIDEYGFDEDFYTGTGGNNIALALVIEALKLQPCSPGFVDGRDAILEADQLLYDGANQCLIWDVFARRGLGVSASQGSSNSRSDGTQAFDTPSGVAELTGPKDVCEDVPVMTGLSGGTPFGGVYSGPGITDDGNGTTYSFDPAAAGVGVHTITYSVPATACADASSATDQVEVTPGIIIDCPDDIIVDTSSGSCSAVVTFTAPLGTSGCEALNGEDFDGVGAPNLPEGWTTTTDQGTSNNWKTSTAKHTSAPNAAFVANLSSTSLSTLTSPGFQIESSGAVLKFKLNHNTENNYDGMVLEYSVDNGSWKDILSGGGSFVSGGYSGAISSYWGNPLGGRQAWFGNSGGFKDVEINLASNMAGSEVKFRWRMGSDYTGSGSGVYLDEVVVEGVFAPEPVTTQISGLPSGSEFPAGVTTNTFRVEDGGGNVKTCSFDVIVNDGVAPEINCPETHTVHVNPGETYTVADFWAEGVVTATDNCTEVINQTQSPAIGAALPVGEHTVDVSVTDEAGNLSECSFLLKVVDELGVNDVLFGNNMNVYPNPTSGNVTILNPGHEHIQKVIVTDMSGRTLGEFGTDNSLEKNEISIKHYPAGTYLFRIIGERGMTVKKVVKK